MEDGYKKIADGYLYKIQDGELKEYPGEVIIHEQRNKMMSISTPSSRTEKCTASMKTIGYTADKGWFCYSSILGSSLSVISDTIPSLTSKP